MHCGENKHYRDEEVDVALDAFDGQHGDRLDSHKETEADKEATPGFVRSDDVVNRFGDNHD